MNLKPLFLTATLAASLLTCAAQAQLWGTAASTAAQPTLTGFTAKENQRTRGQARLELDRVGERVVGVYVTAPKADTDSVARAILAAWGAPVEAASGVRAVLDDPGFQELAGRQVFEELDPSGTSTLYVRLRGDTWHVYTALKVYPVSSFRKAAATLGQAAAPVRLDIVSDYECPFCHALWDSTSMAEWRAHPETYRLNYHHFPLDMHPRALPAAVYAECAAEGGRFWEFSDQLNANFAAWTHQPEPQARQSFAAYAAASGVAPAALERCLAADHTAQIRQTRLQLAQALAIRGTPTIFLNGVRVTNYNDAAQLQAIRAVTEAAPSAASVIERRVKGLQ